MSKNVIWTQDERTALAAATLNLLSNAAQMPVTSMNSADVQKQAQRYGFFSDVEQDYLDSIKFLEQKADKK
jgi:hypothetical protein